MRPARARILLLDIVAGSKVAQNGAKEVLISLFP
jgi:hypothetical protein